MFVGRHEDKQIILVIEYVSKFFYNCAKIGVGVQLWLLCTDRWEFMKENRKVRKKEVFFLGRERVFFLFLTVIVFFKHPAGDQLLVRLTAV